MKELPFEGGGAFTIRDFCQAHRISPAFYYKMRSEGWGPKEMWAGSRVLISFEAAAAWRRARETAAASGHLRQMEAETSPIAAKAKRKSPAWAGLEPQ